MKSILTYFNIYTILFAFTFFFVYGCNSDQDNGNIPNDTSQEESKIVYVQTMTTALEPFNRYVDIVGEVDTEYDVNYAFKVAGQIVEYYVKRGDRVRRGDKISRIDDVKLKQTENRLKAQLNLAQERYQRQKKVFEEDNVGSEIDLLTMKYAYEEIKAAYEIAKIDLDNAVLIAPFDAFIEDIYVDKGTLVNEGTPVVHLISADQFYVSLDIPARYAEELNRNDRVDLWFDKTVIKGKIRFVGKVVTSKVRTFPVEVELSNYNVDYLKSGLKINARVYIEESQSIVLQDEFIHDANANPYVYIVNQDGEDTIAEKIFIELTRSFKNRYAVMGLGEGQKIITIGSAYVEPGTKIKIINE